MNETIAYLSKTEPVVSRILEVYKSGNISSFEDALVQMVAILAENKRNLLKDLVELKQKEGLI